MDKSKNIKNSSRKPSRIIEAPMDDSENQKVIQVNQNKEIIKKTLSDEMSSKAIQEILSNAYKEALDGRR